MSRVTKGIRGTLAALALFADPGAVVAREVTTKRSSGALRRDYLIMSFRMAAGPAHEQELECIRRFGRDVIPAFR